MRWKFLLTVFIVVFLTSLTVSADLEGNVYVISSGTIFRDDFSGAYYVQLMAYDETPLNITDIISPTILSISNHTLTTEGWSVSLTLDENANATLYASTSSSLSSPTIRYSTTYQTTHSIDINGLSEHTLYYWQVNGSDNAGNEYSSAIYNITTKTSSSTGGGGTGGGGGGGEEEEEEEEFPYTNVTIPETNETTVVSNETSGYYMMIDIGKYAYGEQEDFTIKVRTFRYNLSKDVDSVYFTILMQNISYGKYYLRRTGLGQYELFFDNNLDLGTYDFRFHLVKGIIDIQESREVAIVVNPDLQNIIRYPTGDIKINLFLLILLIIIILIIIIYLRRNNKKLKEKIKYFKRKWKQKFSQE